MQLFDLPVLSWYPYEKKRISSHAHLITIVWSVRHPVELLVEYYNVTLLSANVLHFGAPWTLRLEYGQNFLSNRTGI